MEWEEWEEDKEAERRLNHVLTKASMTVPPGLEHAAHAVHAVSGGDSEWLPFTALKQFTNAFIWDPEQRRVGTQFDFKYLL